MAHIHKILQKTRAVFLLFGQLMALFFPFRLENKIFQVRFNVDRFLSIKKFFSLVENISYPRKFPVGLKHGKSENATESGF